MNMRGKREPTVLYIGAAADNGLEYKQTFIKGINMAVPDAHVESLNLTLSPDCRHGNPQKLNLAFGRADVVYFDGGDTMKLRDIFRMFSLDEYCKEAYERGAYVGGSCGGGSIFAEGVVYSDRQGNIHTDKGVGLIPNVTISAKIDWEEQAEAREAALRAVAVEKAGENMRCIGVGDNQIIIFHKDGLLSLAKPGFHGTTGKPLRRAFTMKPDGTKDDIFCLEAV
nr:hypothetical protein [Cytophagales bacterium]